MASTTIKNGFNGGSDSQLLVNPDGSINATTSGTSTVTGDVNINGLNAFATAQYVVDTTPIQITIPTGTSSVAIKARTTSNTDAVLVGNVNTLSPSIDGTGDAYFLFSGDGVQVDLTSAASVWVVGTSAGQIICVLFAGG